MIFLADSTGGAGTDNEGIKALLHQIAENHPWNQTWWGQLIMFGLTWLLGAAFGWAAGRLRGFKEGIKAERDRPAELISLPQPPTPLPPPREP